MTESQLDVQTDAEVQTPVADQNETVAQTDAVAVNEQDGQKLTNNKDILNYLAEKFPLCFILEGEAKPLKIGLFQDLADALADDPRVSKTQLRHVLRQYTSNWRYLYGCREGAERVDLYGNPAGVLDAEQAAFAATQLAEAKAKVAEKRKAEAAEKRAQQRRQRKPQPTNKPRRPQAKFNAVDLTKLAIGAQVKVKAGGQAKAATVLEIQKDAARVELTNGVVMTVTADRLFA